MPTPPPDRPPGAPADAANAWYRQPLLWLGAAILAASVAGCIWVIMAGLRYPDAPVPTQDHAEVFGVPARTHSSPTPPR